MPSLLLLYSLLTEEDVLFGEYFKVAECSRGILQERKFKIYTFSSPPRRNSGTEDVYSPHGIPMDLLNRLLIIRTNTYNKKDMENILKLRAQTEGHNVNADALQQLADIGSRATLRLVLFPVRRYPQT